MAENELEKIVGKERINGVSIVLRKIKKRIGKEKGIVKKIE